MTARGESRLRFAIMAFMFRIRDRFSPPERTLAEAGMRPGDVVLDFGCGSGSYVAAASKLVGAAGTVHALDRQRAALEAVDAVVSKHRLANVETILSDCATGLPDRSVDVVLLYDTFHALQPADNVLAELARVLKDDGRLSFSDHHLSEEAIRAQVTAGGHFEFVEKGRKTYHLKKRT